MLGERVRKCDPVAVGQQPELVLVAHRAGGRARAEERPAEPRTLLVGPVDEAHGQRRRRRPRRSAAAPRPPPSRSGSRRASRRSAPSRCARRSGAPGRTRPRSVNHWFPASSISSLGEARLARSHARACSHVSVQATRCAPFSSPVSSWSSRSSSTVRAGSSGTADSKRGPPRGGPLCAGSADLDAVQGTMPVSHVKCVAVVVELVRIRNVP